MQVEENLLIADFTHLEYTGKNLLSFATGTMKGYLFKVLAAATGKVICYLALISMLEFKEDLLRDLLRRVLGSRRQGFDHGFRGER